MTRTRETRGAPGRTARTMLVGLLLSSTLAVRARARTSETEDDNELREDVILCEEAVTHAKACCGLRVQSDACRFYSYESWDSCGCDGGDSGYVEKKSRPVLQPAEARRITALDCEELRAKRGDGTSRCDDLRTTLNRQNESYGSRTKNCR